MIYDKLKNLESFAKPFSFECSCGCNGLKKGNWSIRPIGISYKPEGIDNSDIENKFIRKQLNELPTLRQALQEAVSNSVQHKPILIFCNSCKQSLSNTDNITRTDIRKWLNKNIPFSMNLKMGRDEIDRRKHSNNR